MEIRAYILILITSFSRECFLVLFFPPMRTLGFSSRLIEGKPRVSLQVCFLSKPVRSALGRACGVVRMAPGAGF